jgi:hypothetical protein
VLVDDVGDEGGRDELEADSAEQWQDVCATCFKIMLHPPDGRSEGSLFRRHTHRVTRQKLHQLFQWHCQEFIPQINRFKMPINVRLGLRPHMRAMIRIRNPQNRQTIPTIHPLQQKITTLPHHLRHLQPIRSHQQLQHRFLRQMHAATIGKIN